jgi:PPK2 family polyphosphate:nucleotide phosphotransferase
MGGRFGDLLRNVDLAAVDPRSTPGIEGGKAAAEADRAKLAARLSDLQEQLIAEGRTGGTRSVLLVLQGIDTSGKGGTVRHVVGQVDPAGVEITAFKAPTPQERRRGFLWRIRRRLPPPGVVGVFDRSHYEDVVAAHVRGDADRGTVTRRHNAINAFERETVAAGTKIVKCFLHISRDEQRERLLARLDDPTKQWKFNPGDLDDRLRWDDYMEAYAAAIERCDDVPWHVVPADRKWYRNWAITRLLVEQLEDLDLVWPEPDYDVEEQRRRLRAIP